MLQPGFHSVPEKAWSDSCNSDLTFSSRLIDLQGRLKHWKNSDFGSLHRGLLCLQWRTVGIHNSQSYTSSSFLHHLEISLQKESALKQLQQATFWKQRSKVKWLQEGDKNIKIFHIVSKANLGETTSTTSSPRRATTLTHIAPRLFSLVEICTCLMLYLLPALGRKTHVMPQFCIPEKTVKVSKLARYFTENPRTFKIVGPQWGPI